MELPHAKETDPLLLKTISERSSNPFWHPERLLTEIHLDCELCYNSVPPGEGFFLSTLFFCVEKGGGSNIHMTRATF